MSGSGPVSFGDDRVASFAASKIGDYLDTVAATGLGWASRQVLSAVEVAEERLLAGLRIDEGVAFADLAALDLTGQHPRVIQLAELGLLSLSDERMIATPAGRTVLDAVTSALAVKGLTG
jgi:oxygen-independent coproporphyrinogen-3 oxidase